MSGSDKDSELIDYPHVGVGMLYLYDRHKNRQDDGKYGQ